MLMRSLDILHSLLLEAWFVSLENVDEKTWYPSISALGSCSPIRVWSMKNNPHFCCRYHPFKPVRMHELHPGDNILRLAFSQWIITLTDEELLRFLFSDEANFELHGMVNSQNVRRYAPLKSLDPQNGWRPEHFMVEKPTYSPKLHVFCGIWKDGTFGLKFWRDMERMTGEKYHSLLQYHVLPEVTAINGGDLNKWVMPEGCDGLSCKCCQSWRVQNNAH